MNKAGQFISHLVYNKFFWQLLLAFFMIGMAAFFIKNEHIELIQIKDQLATSRPDYIILGVILTVVYIGLQGQMYVHSFKALGNSIPIDAATLLFLKRNLVSVFLPAGGFSSLAFFTKEIENHGPTRSQIHLASTLFAFCSLLSVIIVGLPAIGIAFLFHSLQTAALLGFAFLIILTIGFIIVMRSVAIKGRAYYWVSRTIPSTAVILNEMISQKIDRKQFLMTLIASIGIEIVGIIHLYVAMLALGFDPSWPAAFIGYIVMVILLIASPFLRGLGAIEVSLTYVLGQLGYPIIAAATITLLFRLFEFWIPLFAGILSFSHKERQSYSTRASVHYYFCFGIGQYYFSNYPCHSCSTSLGEKLNPRRNYLDRKYHGFSVRTIVTHSKYFSPSRIKACLDHRYFSHRFFCSRSFAQSC